jgi:hypothetical protein
MGARAPIGEGPADAGFFSSKRWRWPWPMALSGCAEAMRRRLGSCRYAKHAAFKQLKIWTIYSRNLRCRNFSLKTTIFVWILVFIDPDQTGLRPATGRKRKLYPTPSNQ